MHSKVALLDDGSQRSTKSHIFKVAIALIGGSCLVLLSVLAISASSPALPNASAAESTSLFGMPTSLRKPGAALPMMMPKIADLPGASPWKELTMAAVEASQSCNRDVSMNVMKSNEVKAVMASMSRADRAVVEAADAAVAVKAQDLLKAGQVPPFGFWDPVNLATNQKEGTLLFFREAELKHGRVCMLAFLGILVGENFHPLFGGNIDIPAAKHFTLVGGDEFWALGYVQFLAGTFWLEKKTSFPILEGQALTGLIKNDSPYTLAAKGGRVPGDLGFDPLNLKPKTEKGLLEMQNKEIQNGRLAMLAVIGVLAQELVTSQKVFR